MPPRNISLGSITKEHEQYRIHLRRAIEAIDSGRNPVPHLLEAFSVDPGDLAAAVRAKKYLDQPELNDAKRLALKNNIGQNSYDELEHHDLMLELTAAWVEEFAKAGREIKSITREAENIEYKSTHPSFTKDR